MALKIYPDEGISSAYTQDGSLTNAFRQAFDGRTGTIRETLIYVGNNDIAKAYTNITLSTLAKTGKDVTDGTDGYGIKLSAGSDQPTEDGWRAVSYGNSLSLGAIPDTSTYLPFWVRIEVPRGAPVQSFTGVAYRLTADES